MKIKGILLKSFTFKKAVHKGKRRRKASLAHPRGEIQKILVSDDWGIQMKKVFFMALLLTGLVVSPASAEMVDLVVNSVGAEEVSPGVVNVFVYLTFAATGDMKELLVATARTTRKYANLADNTNVAMLIDSRSNQEADFHEAITVTATGTAEEITETEQEALLALYLGKHPHLVDFVNAPTCALIRVRVTCYYLVSRFQNVVEVHIR